MSAWLKLRRFDPARGAEAWLGAAVYGDASSAPGCVQVPLPLLPAGGALGLAWQSAGPFVQGRLGALDYCHDEHFLFGAITLSEAACPPLEGVSRFQQISQQAYSALFALLQQSGFSHLLRCWNYLPRINLDGGGLERYRQFNIGRQDAFMAAGQAWLEGSPSACALGTAEGDLVLYFLAGKQAALPIENPRQVSAYRYPQQYGPRAPTFSRASLLRLPAQEVLFISGTASIVGHESVHPEDVRAQTRETLNNLDAVVAQANLQARLGQFSSRALSLKVYVRHAADLAAVREEIALRLGEAAGEAVYLLADICRAELLVEIEAFGFLGEGEA